VKRVDLWRAKMKAAQAEMKIVVRQANSLAKRRDALKRLMKQLEAKIGAVLAKT
jgi:hypothetical protein